MVLDSWDIGRNPLRAVGSDNNEKSNQETGGESMAGGGEVGAADSPDSRCVEEPLCEQELNIFLMY